MAGSGDLLACFKIASTTNPTTSADGWVGALTDGSERAVEVSLVSARRRRRRSEAFSFCFSFFDFDIDLACQLRGGSEFYQAIDCNANCPQVGGCPAARVIGGSVKQKSPAIE